jgi:hypothetical protein
MEKIVAGELCRVLTDEEANIRRRDFVETPGVVDGIYHLERVIGKKAAHDYFAKVLDNLKYEAVNAKELSSYCPCVKRKAYNPNYVCTGDQCKKNPSNFSE